MLYLETVTLTCVVDDNYKLVLLLLILLLPLVCMIPLEHFGTINYVHVREGRLVYLQKNTGAGYNDLVKNI